MKPRRALLSVWDKRELVEMGTQVSSQGDPVDVAQPRPGQRRRVVEQHVRLR